MLKLKVKLKTYFSGNVTLISNKSSVIERTSFNLKIKRKLYKEISCVIIFNTACEKKDRNCA